MQRYAPPAWGAAWRGVRLLCSAATEMAPMTPTTTSTVPASKPPKRQRRNPCQKRVIGPKGDLFRLNLRTRRRLVASPSLPLEAVSVRQNVQNVVEKIISVSAKSDREVRRASRVFDRVRAPESLVKRNRKKPIHKNKGAPRVQAPATYEDELTRLANTTTFAVSSLASNVYVMEEVRRTCADFVPRTMLDFGTGSGTAVSAAARVFRESRLEALRGKNASMAPMEEDQIASSPTGVRSGDDAENPATRSASNDEDVSVGSDMRTAEGSGRPQRDWLPDSPTTLSKVVIVDRVKEMHRLADMLLSADEFISQGAKPPELIAVSELHDVRKLRLENSEQQPPLSNPTSLDPDTDSHDMSQPPVFDLVSASYVLSSIVREHMAEGDPNATSTSATDRERIATRALRKAVQRLWSHVRPGGVLTILDTGTLAGFDTILFARTQLLNAEPEVHFYPTTSDNNHSTQYVANVLAPCLHSMQCPLAGSTTRARICRFVQRFNRPPYLRRIKPKHDGFEDEYFSYIVLRKSPVNQDNATAQQDENVKEWGRVIRQPKQKPRHIIFDACTKDAKLERHVLSRSNAPDGLYPLARRTLWGDVWPLQPPTAPQDVHF